MYAFIIDPVKGGRKIKSRIMKVLRTKVKGEPISISQANLQKQVGCSIRAGYICYLLETLQDEGVVMKDRSDLWALWDAPRSIVDREWRAQYAWQQKEWQKARDNSPAGRAEKARKEAE